MLVSTVELAWRTRRAAELGITGTEGAGLDWAAVIARKNRLVASWSEGKDAAFERQGISVLRGPARFLGPHELQVGDRRVTAERVVIATGSSPKRLSIEGIERALTSDHFSLFPTATFTIPAVGQVGLTEAAARQQGVTVGVARIPFEDSTAAAVRSETEGFVKVVFDQTSGRILGVHILGAGAEDLVHVAAVAMRGGLTRDALASMHYVLPTLAGSVFDAMWD